MKYHCSIFFMLQIWCFRNSSNCLFKKKKDMKLKELFNYCKNNMLLVSINKNNAFLLSCNGMYLTFMIQNVYSMLQSCVQM